MLNKSFIKFFFGFLFILAVSFGVMLLTGNFDEKIKATVDDNPPLEEVE